jgi:hypothetical protein
MRRDADRLHEIADDIFANLLAHLFTCILGYVQRLPLTNRYLDQ